MSEWPNFFIVGPQKSGTTSLYHYLKGHPDIYMSRIKEPYFFAHVEAGAERALRAVHTKVIREESVYLRLFEGATTHTAVGEATPSYLCDEYAPFRIHGKVPHAKIIMVLRNPVERAYSQYLMNVWLRGLRIPFYEAVLSDYHCLQKGFGVSELYVEQGLYYAQVKRYLDLFGYEQVRIYLLEDMTSDTTGVVEGLCDFLGVPFLSGSFFDATKRYETYKSPRNALVQKITGNQHLRSLAVSLVPRWLILPVTDRILLTKPTKPPIDQKAKEDLASIFHEDILRTQDLIDRDLHKWL